MNDFPLTGGCNCRAVRFEGTEPLVVAATATASAASIAPERRPRRVRTPHPARFRIVGGEDRLRAWKPDDGGEKRFCGDCRSSLFARNPHHADPIGIRMGALDGDPGIRPSVRQFVAYAAPWEPIADDGPPRYPGSRHTLS